MPIITLTTDFGPGRYVAQMKGVLLSLCPGATIVDVAHDVPPQDLVNAAILLEDVVRTFPAGTIHLVVVDPGVGTRRRALVAEAGPAAPGQRFVGPDNGVFGAFLAGGQTRLLENRQYMRATVSPVFHGRDVFAPAAATLANGAALDTFGPAVEDPLVLQVPRPAAKDGAVTGEVLYADKFGNIVTNIGAGALPEGGEDGHRVEIGWARIDGLSGTYADVRVGEMLALIGSSGRLEIAVREGSAAERLGLKQLRGTAVKVHAARPSLYGS